MNLQKLILDIQKIIDSKGLAKSMEDGAFETIGKIVQNQAIWLEGDMAEVGVSVGNTAEVICKAKRNKILHLFDTWEGHPKEWIGKYDWGQTSGKHKADIEMVKKRLKKYPNVNFYKGIFPKDTSRYIEDKKFCFVYLDTDLYRSTYEALDFFVIHMVKGGIILFDDFAGVPGVGCAIEDYCQNNDEKLSKLIYPQPQGFIPIIFINKLMMNFKRYDNE